MKFSNIVKLLFVCIGISSYASASIEKMYSVDTLLITSKTGIIMSHKEVVKTMQSKDVSKKAELFYNTGYALANKVNPTEKSLRKAISYLTIASEYYITINNLSQYSVCLENLGTIEYELTNYEKSISHFQKAIDIYETNFANDIKHLAQLNNNIAFIYFNTFRYENSLSYFTKTLHLYTQINDTINIGRTYYYKGLVFSDNNMLDSTLFYYEKALKYDEIIKNEDEILASYNNLAVIHTKKRNFNQAIAYLDKAQSIVDKQKESRTNRAIQMNNYGNIYFHKKDYTKSLDLYTKSLLLKRELKDNEGIAISLHNIANVYIATGKLNLAKNSLHEALALTKTVYPNNLYGTICKTTSKLYEALKDSKQALHYYELFIENCLSILTEDISQISEVQDKYEEGMFIAASIQREIKMQQMLAAYDFKIKKDSINALDAKRKSDRTKLFIILGVLLAIIIGGIILFNRYLLKKKANAKLEIQNKEISEQNIVIAQQTQALLDSNQELEKLSIVASKTDNAIMIMDQDGYFEWVNEAFTKIFGFTFDELCRTVSNHMIGENTPQNIIDKFNYCKEHKTTVQYEIESKNKAQETLWIQVTLTPILDENGDIRRLVMIDSDITDLKKAELEITAQKEQIEQQKEEQSQQRDYVIAQSKELEAKKGELTATLEQLKTAQDKLVESEKMAALGGLVAGISHEINTPVGVGTAASSSLATRTIEIIELFQTKKMKLSDLQAFIDTAQNACDLILKNLHRTADLVKSFNQVSVDNMSEQKRTFNLHEYLHDIVRSLGPKFKGRKVELTISCNESIELTSYPGAFAQIFTNFIINSLIHGYKEEDEGLITITVDENEQNLTCIYKDNGKGIPAENQPKVFEAFFTTDKKEGTGLGMNITYNLVTQKLGGEISLWSDTNKGVEFTIIIPKANITA